MERNLQSLDDPNADLRAILAALRRETERTRVITARVLAILDRSK